MGSRLEDRDAGAGHGEGEHEVQDEGAGGAGADLGDALRLPADASAAPRARSFVAQRLADVGRAALVDDAQLVVSELVSNAVLHARSAVGVRVLPLGDVEARLEVEDSSPVAPTFGLMDTRATSGRGLLLVDALSRRWGTDVDLSRGKTVWAELSAAAGPPGDELTADDLLGMWDDEPSHDAPADQGPGTEPEQDPAAAELVAVRLEQVPVAVMRAAKLQVEETVRDLQLVLLSASHLHGDSGDTGSAGRTRTDGSGPDVDAATEEVRLARRLDAAAEEFGQARRQLRAAVMTAAAGGAERATLTLRLPQSDVGAARRYLEALDEAEALAAHGRLLLVAQLREHADLRRWYLGEIVTQLEGAATGARPGTA